MVYVGKIDQEEDNVIAEARNRTARMNYAKTEKYDINVWEEQCWDPDLLLGSKLLLPIRIRYLFFH
jgi:hypothetical protein